MKEELTKQLLDKYPDLLEEHWLSKERARKHNELLEEYRKAKLDGNEEKIAELEKERNEIGSYYAIAYGFECGDGWYNLLDELMGKIKELDKEKVVKVNQIKEKFGGLRFYIQGSFVIDFLGQGTLEMPDKEDGTPKDVHELIRAYQDKSYSVCEVCGKEGQLCMTKGRWYKTVCKEHRGLETWTGHKQEYLPCYKFSPEEEVILLSDMTLAKVEKLAFDEARDEWNYEIKGKIYYKDELKRKPRQKFYKDQYVAWGEDKDELVVEGVENYIPTEGYSYKLTNPVDNSIWNVFEDELEEVVEQTEDGWPRRKYRKEDI